MATEERTYYFYATILDRRDYSDVPKTVERWGFFEAIDSLDSLCHGGTRIGERKRRDCSIYTDALSSFRIGNAIVTNGSFGWHPDYATEIRIFGDEPDSDIVQRFEKFYCKKPTVKVVAAEAA